MLNTLQKTAAAAAALAAAGTMMIPASASAQSYYGQGYDRYDDRGYDQCYRDSRTAGGAVIGGTIGAVAGSQLAARGRRTEGSILGGVLGAFVGGAAGRDSSRYCDDRYRSGYDYDRYDDRYSNNGYYGRDYDDRYNDDRYSRGQTYYTQPYNSGYGYQSGGYGYQGGSYDRGYSDRYYSSDRYGSGYSSGYSQSCRTVQSTTRDRYGRTVTHYREVC